MGKTAFALQWAVHLAETYRVGFFSLETSAQKLADRIVSRQARVGLSEIKQRIFPGDAWSRIDRACCEVAS